jgi:hypothetical protein
VVRAVSDPSFFTLENNHRCLDVKPEDTSASGANLQVFPCHWHTNQQFRLIDRGGGEWQIMPKLGVQYNLGLDIEGGAPREPAVPPPSAGQEPAFVGCDSDEWLRLQWYQFGVPRTITLYQGNAGSFPGRTFARWVHHRRVRFPGFAGRELYVPQRDHYHRGKPQLHRPVPRQVRDLIEIMGLPCQSGRTGFLSVLFRVREFAATLPQMYGVTT